MKKENSKENVTLSVNDYNEMLAEAEAMKLTLQQQQDQLDETNELLATTQQELQEMIKEVRHLRTLLHASAELQTKAEATARNCVEAMRGLLFHWLTKENRVRVKTMLKFYTDAQKVYMMKGLLDYLVFGKRAHFDREVENTHFRIICGKLDEDAVTVPAHSLMVKLLKKYGPLQGIEE